jgi:nanoRNase/pAp phosphatase (c-di-AMP/oligoRNAs hydrolase)
MPFLQLPRDDVDPAGLPGAMRLGCIMHSVKVLIAGDGAKSLEIAEAVVSKHRKVYIISQSPFVRSRLPEFSRFIHADPGQIRIQPLGLELTEDDVLIVIDNNPDSVRRTVHNLRAQASAPDMVVISDDATLRGEFPELLIRSQSAIYRDELHEVLKRVNTRKRIDDIRQLIKRVQKVLILIWGNPDPDAIASAWALRGLFEDSLDKIEIVYQGEFTRPENQAMVETLQIPMRKFRPEMVTPGTSVFTVDAQPSFFRLDRPVEFDVVIDHHPKTEEPTAAIADIRSSYGATSTILSEYYVHSRTKIPRRVATALWYGLKTDTNNLTRNVNEADIRAFRLLKSLADEDLIRTIELSQLPVEVLDSIGRAIATKEIAGDVVLTYLGPVANPDYAVYVADLFVRVSTISVAIAATRTDGKLIVILRSDGLRHDVGKIAGRVFGGYGTAGGHRTMARAELDWAKIEPELGGASDDAAVKEWLTARLAIALKALAGKSPKTSSRTGAA